VSTQLLEGKVASVLNERELVINVGERDGVRRGMRFAVLAGATEIPDPDTGESLGTIDRTKVRVQAVHVQERLSICQTYELRAVGGGLHPAGMSNLEQLFGPRQDLPRTLKAKEYLPPLDEAESYVKVGDRVRRIEDAVDR
jgi:hypothetical protein